MLDISDFHPVRLPGYPAYIHCTLPDRLQWKDVCVLQKWLFLRLHIIYTTVELLKAEVIHFLSVRFSLASIPEGHIFMHSRDDGTIIVCYAKGITHIVKHI